MQASSIANRAAAPKARPPVQRRAGAGRCRAVRVVSYLEAQAAGAKAPEPPQAANQLEALCQMSKLVADTGEIAAIKKYRPVDCTTNPSLILKAMQDPEYALYLDDAIAREKKRHDGVRGARPHALIADQLAVNIGAELAKLVLGRVSTEVDAHLSHDTAATYDKALHLVDLYMDRGVEPSRLYIKMASTWEGIRACQMLQDEGIDCNMTLIFSFAQAAACADAGAALVSPFVGRIMDWHKKEHKREYSPQEDPGVASVQRIYKYFKRYNYKTIVMAASFRNVGEIRELAGCDNITIAPPLLKELEASTDPLPYKLWPRMGGCNEPHYRLDYSMKEQFDRMHGDDRMAVEKLKEGIHNFAADQDKLEDLIALALAKK